MNPEIYDYVMKKLFNAGAKDVYLTNIIMKKCRPAVKLSVICEEEKQNSLLDIILRETSSLGVRSYKVERFMLNRNLINVKCKYGDIKVKISYYNDLKKYKPEYDDCKSIALSQNISIKEVYKEAMKAVSELEGKNIL